MEMLGVRIDNLKTEEALQKTQEFLGENHHRHIVTVNPEILVLAQKDKEFKEILNKADLSVADGIGIVWASRFLGEAIKERIAGVDLIEKLILRLRSLRLRSGYNAKVFLLGGRGGVAEKIAGEWLEVVGFTEDIDSAVSLINQCQPDILFMALGAPRQEKWIAQNLKNLPSVKVAMGVGGAFNMLSGRINRAPKFMRKVGLEWLWRLILEPRRIGRIFNAVIVFPWLVINYRSQNKRQKI
ncbi:MAG: WecB/TagA/CpsF family glycosyltransferase [Candidatus Portnoybacteria bacterium]|nr:WecB/TagA/CpsF family glycosyltransferase [Candidatus Portnoybacteria bacterium]